MAKLPKYERYVEADGPTGFSAIAPGFWRTAEKLRDEVIKASEKESQTIYSMVTLYHAALDCFINEEITRHGALTGSSENSAAYAIQGDTLTDKKIDSFYSHFGLKGKLNSEIRRRTLLLAGLRNRLTHHWPVLRDVRDYPVPVIDALTDAKIERVNTSWIAQCSDIRVATWAAEIVHAFVEEWWRVGRAPDDLDRAHWEYGPKLTYPPKKAAKS
jgi:hypothetical protein